METNSDYLMAIDFYFCQHCMQLLEEKEKAKLEQKRKAEAAKVSSTHQPWPRTLPHAVLSIL